MKKVAVIMGSASDLKIAKAAADTLKSYNVPFTVRVLSAHRTAEEARIFALNAAKDGYGAIIAIAGMAAHLAGAIAANTILPVVGVPASSGGLGGMDALLSTVQMPSGVPVACVALDGGKNAALLCIQMLAIFNESLANKLNQEKLNMAQNAREKDAEINNEYSWEVI